MKLEDGGNKISKEHFYNLLKTRISLDCIYILEMLINKEEFDYENQHIVALTQKLQRKGYINSKGEVTHWGIEFYESLSKPLEVAVKVPKIKDDTFEQWWSIFPSSDFFEFKGKKFEGTRKLNIKKEECKKLFNIYVAEGLLAEDIIGATEFNIESIKKVSFKKGINQMSYLPASERYLSEKRFSPFLSVWKNSKLDEIKSNETFI